MNNNMDTVWHRCNVHYYLHEKCYGKARYIAKQCFSHTTEGTEFMFYHGVADILEGQVQKGISDLTPLQSSSNVKLAVTIALVYGHKAVGTLDRDAVQILEAKLKEERKQAGTKALYYAGLFLSFVGMYEKASDYINKSLKKDSNNLDTIILKGLNEMYMNTAEIQVSTLDCLELALTKSNKNIQALLGIAKFKFYARDFDASNLMLDRLIVNYPQQVVPLVEKLRNEFAMQRWDPVYDTLERIFSLDPNNIEGLKTRIFMALCKNADYIETADQLNQFFELLENEEPNNGYLFYETTQLFSKICSKSSTVLSQVYRFVQYASEMYPNNVGYLSEVGYQCVLQGKYKDAITFFKAASKIDNNSITALCGLTLCQMLENGPTDQVAQQVELLFEMQGTNKLPLLYLLSAQLNHKNSTKAVMFLNNAYETTLATANVYPYSLVFIKHLDPEFLLDVFKEYKKHLPKKPFVIISYLLYSQEDGNPSVTTCFKLLDALCKACPSLISALYELAKLKFAFGYAVEAQKVAQQISDIDNTHVGSQILLAQIYIQQKDFGKATQCLELCLSYNFKIRDSAMYYFLNGVILNNSDRRAEALTNYLTAVQTTKTGGNRQLDSELNIIDKASLYLEIIDVQTALGQVGDASKTMQDTIQELSFTTEEPRLSIAKADIALKKGDIDNAIEILNEIKPGQPYYYQAHSKMAHVYLKEKKDRAMFTTCFRDIVNNNPMADAHSMMGDAFMSINDPAQAVNSYETALKGSPKDIEVVKKLAIALVKMHEYDKALLHYENSIKVLTNEELEFEYYELLNKLKYYDKLDSIISKEIDHPRSKGKDVNSLKRRVRLLITQAKSRELNNPTAGNTTLILTEAKEIQTAIVRRMEIDSRRDIQEEKDLLSNVICMLARVKSGKEPGVAANLYSEALIYTPRDPGALLALAKLYAQMNNTEKCEQTCAVLLNADPNNESAAVMMADLAFRKVDLESAQRHLTQMLSIKPCSWDALSQLVEVQWRRGRLTEAEVALNEALEALDDKDDPGYFYCAGVYSTYIGKVNAALRQLNLARRSPHWRQLAAKRMVLLCLSQHAGDAVVDTFAGSNDETDTRLLALRTAEKLLPEVAPTDRKTLQALLQLATKQKPQAEKVLLDLLPYATEETYVDDPYLILAIANAYNIVKQPTRAKNILKRTVSSIPWTPEKADGLERCWLEVVESQISSGRMDAAKELLAKILLHNTSCVTAYQYMGVISEKEQNHKAAAQNYDNAWVHSGRNDLSIGYKLSHSYLKLKKYPECIVVCRHILKLHPEYPKIRKEIMDKAKMNLRT